MPAARVRGLRLDFFRGLAMLIIFVAHVPGNSWTEYIPARFGFSSAAEMFVFCSGCASAIAFGSVFARRGWGIGTIRIACRIWQLYWAHIGLFLVLATISITAAYLHIGMRDDGAAGLSLGPFATDGLDAIAGLMTLSLVPDLLNILPMYIVLLALVPFAMALSRISPLLVVAASAALWLMVQATGLNLPAGGAPGRAWLFDPFAWQLMFFTGFAFGMGWLPKPRLNHPAVDRFPKTIASPALAPVAAIGRQSLSTFVSSVALAWMAGRLLDVVGRGSMSVAAVNLLGFATILAVARSAAWIKSAPWSTEAERAAPPGAVASSPSGSLARWRSSPLCGPIRPHSRPMHNDAERLGVTRGTPLFRARAALLRLAAGLWAVPLSMGDARDVHACGADLPCLVQGGAYLVRPPAGWDGRSALPTVVFFHGWMQSASDVMRDESMARVTSDLGVLLVAPDGAGHTWSFPGSPGHYRDEFAFIRAVLDDVEARFPIDTRRLWASGFSQGGSMVWYAARFLGDRFAAFVPVAGDFWEPPPPTCPSGPASLRHIHGLADETFPTSGRAVAEHSHQGNLWQGWALWLRTDGCVAPPDRVDSVGS